MRYSKDKETISVLMGLRIFIYILLIATVASYTRAIQKDCNMLLCYLSSFFFLGQAFAISECLPRMADTCPHRGMLMDRMTLIEPSEIYQQCRKYSEYFDCMTKYVGGCDYLSKLKWVPHYRVFQYICSAGKTAYLSYAQCWNEITKRNLVVCNQKMKRELNDLCRSLRNYPLCAETSVSPICRHDAGKILNKIATLYVYTLQKTFRCTLNNKDYSMTDTELNSTNNYLVNSTVTLATTANTTFVSVNTTLLNETMAGTTPKGCSGNIVSARGLTFLIILVNICMLHWCFT